VDQIHCVFQGSPVVRSRSSFEERTNSVTPDFLVTHEPNFPVSASFMNGRLSPAANVAPGPPYGLTRRTCRYLRDLAKRRLGHSHVLNNPASSDGYLQALLVYDRASHSNRGQGPPDGRTVLVGDACGAVSLLAGQGGSLAIAGAALLRDILGPVASRRRLGPALAEFERRWRPVVEAAGRRAVSSFQICCSVPLKGTRCSPEGKAARQRTTSRCRAIGCGSRKSRTESAGSESPPQERPAGLLHRGPSMAPGPCSPGSRCPSRGWRRRMPTGSGDGLSGRPHRWFRDSPVWSAGPGVALSEPHRHGGCCRLWSDPCLGRACRYCGLFSRVCRTYSSCSAVNVPGWRTSSVPSGAMMAVNGRPDIW
jgi:hypothetical protein